MRRTLRPLPLLIPLALVAGCGTDPVDLAPIEALPRELSAAELAIIDGSNAFAFDLLRAVRAARTDSPNTFLSPLSASMALGMTLNGADGRTWSQMADVLGFDGLTESQINDAYRGLIDLLLDLDPRVEFGIGNAIWLDLGTTLLPDFVQRAQAHFDATTDVLDFSDPGAVDVMNEWVADVTRGRIDELIEQIPAQVVLYLINAIYFKGDWRDPFDPRRTKRSPFTRADGNTVMVDMMEGEVGYRVLDPGEPSAARGVELPYGGDAYAAVALLPPADQSIDGFVAGLDAAAWSTLMDRFEAEAEAEDRGQEGTLVYLPKFELEWGDSLNTPLRSLGMVDAFDSGAADLSRLTGARGLWIDHVIQKTFLKVDEEGTEAAAATAVAVVESLPPNIAFDRPFLFAIRERLSGTILFLGVIGDPSGG